VASGGFSGIIRLPFLDAGDAIEDDLLPHTLIFRHPSICVLIVTNLAREQVVEQIAREVDLPQVAEKLGLTVVNIGHSNPKALCPFHDDRHPSLSFYEFKETGRKLFHCFVCGAHGDAYDLVKHQLHCDFAKALEWLAGETLIQLPASATVSPIGRPLGLQAGLALYARQTKTERSKFRAWATSRQFDSTFLTAAEVFFARNNKLSAHVSPVEREQVDALLEAGLLYRPRRSYQRAAGGWLPIELPNNDQIFGDRIIFTIRDYRGAIVGFAGRATVEGESPKYLFSRDFPKGDTLYRLHKVRECLANGTLPSDFHLFVVEGLVDVLRLESLKIPAVGVLGSRLTDSQGKLLADFASALDRQKSQLVLHIFLDADEAGRTGAKASLVGLMREIARFNPEPQIDVVAPDQVGKWPSQSLDPDRFLADAESPEEALRRLSRACYAPAAFLLADELGHSHPASLSELYGEASSSQQRIALRSIERYVERSLWPALFERVGVLCSHPPVAPPAKGEPQVSIPQWSQDLRTYIESAPQHGGVRALPLWTEAEPSAIQRLELAIQIARASTQRREFPVDDGSWDRMLAASDVVVPALAERLSHSHVESWEPMLAVTIPKRNGEKRLKALPCPEDLVLQQYVLNELLRTYDNCPRFEDLIPAVRYYRQDIGKQNGTTTGVHVNGEDFRSVSGKVSFAYQVEMDVVNGQVSRGMFRPYRECWQEFLEFLREQARRLYCPRFYVARLDIKKFYDRVSRFKLLDVLLPPLRLAMRELALYDRLQACAELLQPDSSRTPDEQAKVIVGWLCDQSFHYQFLRPDNGRPDRWEHESQGIPQGPDLSAYLANVSLFPLDYALKTTVDSIGHEFSERSESEEAESKSSVGAAYARYVDDIVLLARSPELLAHLQSLVERHLGYMGLELNGKNEPLPPMDEDTFRDWLTAKRGAGLTVSGETGTTLGCEPLEVLAGLADAGHIERKDCLAILYNRNLDHPDTLPMEVIEAVRIARRSPEIRYGDEVSAAAYLWRCAADPATAITGVKAAVDEMSQLWQKTADPAGEHLATQDETESEPFQQVVSLLIWLEALERALRRPTDDNRRLSSTAKLAAHRWQATIARWINSGLCEELETRFSVRNRACVRHMLDARILSVRRLALQTASGCTLDASQLVRCTPWSPYLARLDFSLAESLRDQDFNRAQAVLERQELRSDGDDVSGTLVLFHEAVARLALYDPLANSVEQRDPLEPLCDRVNSLLSRSENHCEYLLGILELWLPHSIDNNAELRP
jgi:DNA primase catalytic core